PTVSELGSRVVGKSRLARHGHAVARAPGRGSCQFGCAAVTDLPSSTFAFVLRRVDLAFCRRPWTPAGVLLPPASAPSLAQPWPMDAHSMSRARDRGRTDTARDARATWMTSSPTRFCHRAGDKRCGYQSA